MQDFPKIKRLGKRAFLVEFEPEISAIVLDKVLQFKKFIQEKLFKADVEVINTFNSLLIYYESTIEDVYREILSLKEDFEKANIQLNFKSRLFHVPVCYDLKFALDLEEISAAKKLSKEEIIRLHTAEEYLVYFTGFLPGFLYLGGLPQALHFSRKKQPRLRVEKGAVGIGEKQTGIYPQESPGGWNIIGNSPVPLFDAAHDPPCEIGAGDRIRFYAIDLEEHENLSRQVKEGNFRYKIREENG